MNFVSDKYFWLMYLLASTRVASTTADPAVHSNLVFHNSAEALGQLKIEEALRTDIHNNRCAQQAPITENSTATTFLPAIQLQPTFPAPSTQLPAQLGRWLLYQNESSTHYNASPKMGKMLLHYYHPKARDLIPYVKRSGNVLTRAWKKLPVIRHREPTYNLGDRLKAAVGFVTYVPLLICCTAFFFNVLLLGVIAVGYNVWDLTTLSQGAVRKRGMGNWYATVDLNKFDYKKIFSFDFFLSSDHSRTLATLAAHVEKALIDYKHSLNPMSDDVPTSRSYLANPAG